MQGIDYYSMAHTVNSCHHQEGNRCHTDRRKSVDTPYVVITAQVPLHIFLIMVGYDSEFGVQRTRKKFSPSTIIKPFSKKSELDNSSGKVDISKNHPGFLFPAIYLTSVMATTGLSLFVTVLILHLHHKTHKAPVPDWLRKVLFLKIRPSYTNEKYAMEVNTKKVAPGSLKTNDRFNMSANRKDDNTDNVKEKRTWCHLSFFEVDGEWRMAIRRIDRISFFVFLFISIGLLLAMFLLRGDTTRLNREECTM